MRLVQRLLSDAEVRIPKELEDGSMPLMPEYLAQSLVFIYVNAKSAQSDKGFLGIGFFVGLKSPSNESFHYDYIVTNHHVIEGFDSVALRFDVIGGVRTIENVPFEAWTRNKSHDIAVLPRVLKDCEFSFIPRKMFIDKELFKKHRIGAGDEVCLISRVYREKMQYLKRNVATLRFGNISLVPQYEEWMYLVELRSIAGHSGSPVLVYCPPFVMRGTRTKDQMWSGFLFLGINRGHLREYEEIVSVKDRNVKSEHWVSQTNMAMSQIVPAWYIVELLDRPELKKARRSADSQLKRNLIAVKED